jgi:probable F420-dependent oxidoreductase
MKIGFVPKIYNENPGVARRYGLIRDLVQQAEAEGFDSIWTYDHMLMRLPDQPTEGPWESWTILTALAEATRKVELGTIVLCTQFRNPALLAKMAVTLDEVSDGRLTLGLGAGAHEPEFRAFGYPFDHRVGRFEEALKIIGPLLRESRVDFTGKYYQALDCEIVPRGPRPKGPPILVAGAGPRMLRLTAQHADLWNTAWLGKPEPLVARKETIDQACLAVGRDPATLELTVGIFVSFPDLGDPLSPTRDVVTGSTEEVAATLAEYDRLGVSHLLVILSPDTPAALTKLADAMRLYRSNRR